MNQIQPTVHSWAGSVTVAVGIVSVVLLAHIDRFSLFRMLRSQILGSFEITKKNEVNLHCFCTDSFLK